MIIGDLIILTIKNRRMAIILEMMIIIVGIRISTITEIIMTMTSRNKGILDNDHRGVRTLSKLAAIISAVA